jgi:hypothetical protein
MQIPGVKTKLYDRENMADENNNKYTYYLYTANGVLWANDGQGLGQWQFNRTNVDRIVAYDLPWDPRTVINGMKLGPYNAQAKWRSGKLVHP